jgi:hypothetical protein
MLACQMRENSQVATERRSAPHSLYTGELISEQQSQGLFNTENKRGRAVISGDRYVVNSTPSRTSDRDGQHG